MREQLRDCESGTRGSCESLASTCSTATEIPVKQNDTYKQDNDLYDTMRSPSEGYKSACSDSNLADTESFSDSRSSSISNFSKNSEQYGRCRPSLHNFTTSLMSEGEFKVSSHSLMSESMFCSTYSSKYEALEDKVRKLCQSTTNLDEKMRLARQELVYIQVK